MDTTMGVAPDARQFRQRRVLERADGQAHLHHLHGFLDADDGPVFEVRLYQNSWARPRFVDSLAPSCADAASARERNFQGLPHRMVRRHGGIVDFRCRGRLEILHRMEKTSNRVMIDLAGWNKFTPTIVLL